MGLHRARLVFRHDQHLPQLRAAWCNLYVLARAGRVVVGRLNPGGLLACLLSEIDPDKEIVWPAPGMAAL